VRINSSSNVLDQRGQLLRAALGFAGLPRSSSNRALSGRCDFGSIPGPASDASRSAWLAGASTFNSRGTTSAGGATFYTTGMEHSPTSAAGTGWESTPWHATQRAAWEALKKAQEHTTGTHA
jgi:hypothetical protein